MCIITHLLFTCIFLNIINTDSCLLFRAAPDIWFDDVDDIFIEKPKQTGEGEKPKVKLNPLVRPNSFEGYVSFMSCFYLYFYHAIYRKLNKCGYTHLGGC